MEEDNPDSLRRYTEEVQEARDLLEFAVANGRLIESRLISEIKLAEEVLREGELPGPEARTKFEEAYRDLVAAMAPVTARTLRATSDAYGRKVFLIAQRFPLSEAKLWSRKLGVWTIIVGVFLLFSESMKLILDNFYPVDEETRDWSVNFQIASIVLDSIRPVAYGTLGALAYLLRSCHQFIHERTFDPSYISEYYNRMFLGGLSGGAILLFAENLTTEDGAFKIAVSALAFIAGYNTDFLFNTVERIIAAILPKIGIETMRREPLKLGHISMEQLIEKHAAATNPDDKAFYQNLINKLTGKP